MGLSEFRVTQCPRDPWLQVCGVSLHGVGTCGWASPWVSVQCSIPYVHCSLLVCWSIWGFSCSLQENVPQTDGHRQQKSRLTASTELCLIYGPFCSAALHSSANLLQLLFQQSSYSFLVQCFPVLLNFSFPPLPLLSSFPSFPSFSSFFPLSLPRFTFPSLIYFFTVPFSLSFFLSAPIPGLSLPPFPISLPSVCCPSGDVPVSPAEGAAAARSRSARRGGAGRRHRLSLPLPFSSLPCAAPRSGSGSEPQRLRSTARAAAMPRGCAPARPPWVPSPPSPVPAAVPAARHGCPRAAPAGVPAEGGAGTRAERPEPARCLRSAARPALCPVLTELRPRLPLEAQAALVGAAGSASARSAASLGHGRLQPPSSGLEGSRPRRAPGLAAGWGLRGLSACGQLGLGTQPAFPELFSASRRGTGVLGADNLLAAPGFESPVVVLPE